jgi:hypothetical protein
MVLGFEYVFSARPLDLKDVASSTIAWFGKNDRAIHVTVKPGGSEGWILFFRLKKPLHIGVG